MSALPKYALVKWLTGNDQGKYSTVETSWVLNLTLEEYNLKKTESYIIEWKHQKKQPLGGWPCYDAQLLKLSDSKTALDRELSKILQEKEVSKPGSSEKVAFPELFNITNSDDSISDPTFKPSEDDEKETRPSLKRKDVDLKNEDNTLKKRYKDLKKQMKSLRAENDALKEENAKLRIQSADEIPAMLAAMKDVAAAFANSNMRPSTSIDTVPPRMAGIPQDQVEVFPGTKVFVSAAAWLSAKACSTAGSFIGRLLVTLFDKEVLLKSNLKGGAQKCGTASERREKLDPQIISAIKGAARAQFPDLKDAQFGIYVNQKIANIRSKEKKEEKMKENEEKKKKENKEADDIEAGTEGH